jgi:hypothetical protein
MPGDEGVDRRHKAIVDRTKKGGRRNRVPEMVMQEVTEAT